MAPNLSSLSSCMLCSLIPVKALSSLPYEKGAILFLSDYQKEKITSLMIDGSVGHAISLALHNETSPRPLTHDLSYRTLLAFNASLEKMVITHCLNGIYYSTLTFSMENEVMHKKIVEIDSRLGDGMALALRFQAPVYISKEVWYNWKDDTSLYNLLNSSSLGD